MKLEQAQELYTDYMEGTLSPAMRLALEQHFERDAEAREDYKAFRLIVASFEKVQPLELDPPSGFRASILERVTSQQAAAAKPQSFSFADTIRDWFSGSQLRRMGSVGVATVAVAAVVFAGFHGHNNATSTTLNGNMGLTIPTNSVSTTVLGVSMKSGDDGNQYHLFRVHLPASIPEATVNAEVLSDPSQITDTAARTAQARPALKQAVDLTNDEELQIPVALLQAVPADATITLLVQWQPTDSQQAVGEQVVFTPANPDAAGTTVPVSPDSSESFYDALQFISSAYHVTIISDTSAPPDLMINGWSATTQPNDAVTAVAQSAGYKVRQVDTQTYQFYK